MSKNLPKKSGKCYLTSRNISFKRPKSVFFALFSNFLAQYILTGISSGNFYETTYLLIGTKMERGISRVTNNEDLINKARYQVEQDFSSVTLGI